jgi:DNA-binding NtrC family response regulator
VNDTPPPDDGRLRVLVVDDEDDLRLGLAKLIGRVAATRAAKDGTEALATAREETFDVVVTDLRMPQMGGAELLAKLKTLANPPEVVIVTGYGTIQTAVACLQAGAAHFLTKPFDNDEVLRIVERLGRQARAARGLAADVAVAAAPLAEEPEDVCDDGIVAADPAMRRTLELVDRVAQSPVSVLIEGESGTGKELLARRLHARSPVADRPFMAVNTAALPDTLLESELFGHRRGAFTGADRDREGLFVEARGGTVFLDEISSMSASFQGKLLRVLQERVVRPLGAAHDVPVTFRLVSASNRDLAAMSRGGSFRDDLYFRLGVVVVKAPPLRDRPADVVPLAKRFLAASAAVCLPAGTPPPQLSADSVAALRRHPWPGNVRELQNAVQRAVVVAEGATIEPHHLGLDLRGPIVPEPNSPDEDYNEAKQRVVDAFQNEFVRRALERTGGNVSQAAERCGLTRTALQRIMRRIGLPPRGGD